MTNAFNAADVPNIWNVLHVWKKSLQFFITWMHIFFFFFSLISTKVQLPGIDSPFSPEFGTWTGLRSTRMCEKVRLWDARTTLPHVVSRILEMSPGARVMRPIETHNYVKKRATGCESAPRTVEKFCRGYDDEKIVHVSRCAIGPDGINPRSEKTRTRYRSFSQKLTLCIEME